MKRPLQSPAPWYALLLVAVAACGGEERAAVQGEGDTLAAPEAQPSESGLEGTGTVYTADERSNSLSAIDLASGEVRTVPLPITPHNVQVSADGRLLLAIGPVAAAGGEHGESRPGEEGMSEESMEMRGRVVILDPTNLQATAAQVPVGRHPAHVIVDSAGARAYASNSEDNTLTVIDLARRQAVGTIPVCEFPHGLRMSPDGREIYVACVEGNSVGVVDVAQGKQVARIPVGRAPVQVGFTPDGKRVYVSLRDENAAAAIDVAQRRKTATIPVGKGPIQVYATPDGRFVYVANQGTEESPDSTASAIDTRTDQVVATIPTGAGAHGVAMSTDGRYVFIANTFANTMSVIDVAAQRVARTFPTGQGPGGITYQEGEARTVP